MLETTTSPLDSILVPPGNRHHNEALERQGRDLKVVVVIAGVSCHPIAQSPRRRQLDERAIRLAHFGFRLLDNRTTTEIVRRSSIPS
eukprot:scaffold167080_cov30-Tisochrysis_lutea.AAC.2